MLDLYDNIELPNLLSEEETIRYFKEYKNGNLEAKNILIESNLKLVIDIVIKKFGRYGFELEELVSVGNFGLINAVNTYDIDKKTKFSTYAYSCIIKILIVYVRKNYKHLNIDSLNEVVFESTMGVELTKLDLLVDKKTNVDEECINKQVRLKILDSLDVLTERNREIVKLYYGFYNNRCYTQLELAEMYGVSHQNISLILTKSLKKIARVLEKNNILENTDISIRLLKKN